jgi:hypothetical protein
MRSVVLDVVLERPTLGRLAIRALPASSAVFSMELEKGTM